MNIFTVSFFGHRQIDNPLIVEKKLDEYISDLICSKEYVEFLVGRDGEFDKMAASAVRRAKKRYNYGNIFLILILPYARAEFTNNEQAFLEYYDEVEICEKSARAYFKAAIQIRNRAMVDRSDMVISCIQYKSGGAYKTVKYAEKIGKTIINIAEEIKSDI